MELTILVLHCQFRNDTRMTVHAFTDWLTWQAVKFRTTLVTRDRIRGPFDGEKIFLHTR
jgi:hypothetical protein